MNEGSRRRQLPPRRRSSTGAHKAAAAGQNEGQAFGCPYPIQALGSAQQNPAQFDCVASDSRDSNGPAVGVQRHADVAEDASADYRRMSEESCAAPARALPRDA
jgi:hypothetical protein